MITVRQALKKAVEILKSSETQTPVLDAGVILCNVINKDMLFIHTSQNALLEQSQETEYFRQIYKRRQGMPVQYITGKQEFMSLEFCVAPGVLIPRPDTETLVQYLIDYVNDDCIKHDKQPAVLEIGTGSGCIAVSIAYYLKKVKVYASDISGEAIKIARINAERHGVPDRITFIKSDVMEGITQYFGNKAALIDIIVSNPPYIASEEVENLPACVRDYEPHSALSGGRDGLCFYKKIIEEAPLVLNNGGLVAVEVGKGQSQDVAQIMKESGNYRNIIFKKDLSGIERVVAARINHSKDASAPHSEDSLL